MLIYLHGFNSAPESVKAQLLRRYLERRGRVQELRVPALPHWPRQAMDRLERLIAEAGEAAVTLVGSSLGGYYATWLVERNARLKAVLVNPAVRPYEHLRARLGAQENLYTHERYQLTAEHLSQLEALEVGIVLRPASYLLLVETGDEVLDYRAAVRKYDGAQQLVIPGGSHACESFGAHLDRLVQFAGID